MGHISHIQSSSPRPLLHTGCHCLPAPNVLLMISSCFKCSLKRSSLACGEGGTPGFSLSGVRVDVVKGDYTTTSVLNTANRTHAHITVALYYSCAACIDARTRIHVAVNRACPHCVLYGVQLSGCHHAQLARADAQGQPPRGTKCMHWIRFRAYYLQPYYLTVPPDYGHVRTLDPVQGLLCEPEMPARCHVVKCCPL